MEIRIILGILVIIAVLWAIIKQYEVRTVLLAGALAMAVLAGNPMHVLTSFSSGIKQNNLFEPVISSMAFAGVLSASGCDKHLLAVLARLLKRSGPFLVVGVALASMVVNASITSASGVAAAVGIVFIPLLITAGIPAPLACGAVLSGLYGSGLNPGHVYATLVANIAKTTPMDFVQLISFPVIGSVVVSSVCLALIAVWLRKYRPNAHVASSDVSEVEKMMTMRVNYLYAIVPIIPLAILMFGNTTVPMLKMPVSHSMIIGCVIAMLATRSNPQTVCKVFFKGVGDAFANVFGLIVCTIIFVSTMEALGLVKALINVMITNPSIAKISSIFGPFFIAVLSGSGEAPSVAFLQAVAVHANQFGMEVLNMGAMIVLSGTVGRSASMVAACTIICAGIAKVSPVQIIKYNFIPMVLALLFCAFTLDF